jgi:hypothetical protein
VLFILYNKESAQRGNGTQYVNNVLKMTCIKQKGVLKIRLYLLDYITSLHLLFRFRINVGEFPVSDLHVNNIKLSPLQAVEAYRVLRC